MTKKIYDMLVRAVRNVKISNIHPLDLEDGTVRSVVAAVIMNAALEDDKDFDTGKFLSDCGTFSLRKN